MRKYRIIKNGLDQYFVEKLKLVDLPVKLNLRDGLSWPEDAGLLNSRPAELRKEEKWVRCDFAPTTEEAHQHLAYLKYPAHRHYETEERAKEALKHMKAEDECEKLKNKIEVVYEE